MIDMILAFMNEEKSHNLVYEQRIFNGLILGNTWKNTEKQKMWSVHRQNIYRLLHGLNLYFPDIFTQDPVFPETRRVEENAGSKKKTGWKQKSLKCDLC